MRVVIVGFGRVGSETANELKREGHQMVIIENDPEKADKARQQGFAVIEGDGSSEEVLEEAGIGESDAIAALTADVNVNRSACMVGKEHGCRTLLRLGQDFQASIYRRFTEEVDEIIYPERVGAAGAKTALLGGDFDALSELTEELSVTTVEIPEGSPVVGKRVVAVDLPEKAHIYAHGGTDEPMTLPLPKTEIEAGDRVAFTAAPDALDDIRAYLRGEQAV